MIVVWNCGLFEPESFLLAAQAAVAVETHALIFHSRSALEVK